MFILSGIIMRNLLFLYSLLLVFLIGCSACSQELETSTDTVHEEQGPDRSFVTWETCSQMPGDHPCDFTLKDQNGDDWSLYDHYGEVIVIDFSAMWCGVCNNMANDAQVFTDDYGSQGFSWITILVDDATGNPPDQSDLELWCDLYGIDDAHVLAGDRSLIDMTATAGYPISAWPTFVVIDREMVLQYGLVGWNESTVRGYVESVL